METLLAVAEGRAPGYQLTDLGKLDRIAQEFGVSQDLPPQAKARELALAMMEEYGIKKGHLTFTKRLPEARLAKWGALGIVPRGIDWEVTEMMHRTHMGVDNDPLNLLVQALRCALADGWGVSMIATEISDILFGTPKPTASQANIGVLKADEVNIILHGHNPLVSEMVVRAAQAPELVKRAQGLGEGAMVECCMDRLPGCLDVGEIEHPAERGIDVAADGQLDPEGMAEQARAGVRVRQRGQAARALQVKNAEDVHAAFSRKSPRLAMRRNVCARR